MNWLYENLGCSPVAGLRACAQAISAEVSFGANFLAVVISISSIVFFFHRMWKYLRDRSEAQALVDMLQDPGNWPKLSERLSNLSGKQAQPGAAQEKARAYKEGLTRISEKADDFFGWKLISFRAFGVCLTFAFVYPILATLLTWLFTGHGTLGGIGIGADGISFVRRLLVFCLLFINFGIVIWIVYSAERVSVLVGRMFANRLQGVNQRDDFLAKAVRWTSETAILAVAIVVTFIGAGAVAFTGDFTFPFALAIAVALAIALAGALTVAGAGAVTVAAAAGFALTGIYWDANRDNEAIILFFYVILPMPNALADMLSVAVTRGFVRRMLKDTQTWGSIVLEMAVDILFALFCLFGLVCFIVYCLELWNHWGGSTVPPPLDWRAYRDQLLTSPGVGCMLGFMCFTTLLPTLVHFASAAQSMWLYRSAELDRARAALYSLDAAVVRSMPLAEWDAAILPIASGIKRAYRKSGALTALCCFGLLGLSAGGVWGGVLLLRVLNVQPFAI
ncbi:hypothetical protein J7413_20305 [Shimia sp. R10_1]|uniref:hypothetical protein n=1 Tax=Shimia sp. R10_1 TaxID=2821095 RepID=UPI001AD9BB63|nr:hypothetical protein [Shimia sp. R10_1]MBO9475882.1 hypothetical protein [Shimia sp. R10_1]